MTYQPHQSEDLTLKEAELVKIGDPEIVAPTAPPTDFQDMRTEAPRTIKMTRGLNAVMGRLIQEDQARTRMFSPGGLSVLFPSLGGAKRRKG